VVVTTDGPLQSPQLGDPRTFTGSANFREIGDLAAPAISSFMTLIDVPVMRFGLIANQDDDQYQRECLHKNKHERRNGQTLWVTARPHHV
jgi:hypothetical protein